MIFPAEMVSLNTQVSKDRGAVADGGRGGQKGCLPCLLKLPSLETNSECVPEIHKHSSWRSFVEYLHFHSQGGGKGCQNWAIPSVPFPGLGNSTKRSAGWSASLPSIFLYARHFIGSQLQLAVPHVLGSIIQMRKLRLRQRK